MIRMAGLSATPVCSFLAIILVHPPGCIVVAKQLFPHRHPSHLLSFLNNLKSIPDDLVFNAPVVFTPPDCAA